MPIKFSQIQEKEVTMIELDPLNKIPMLASKIKISLASLEMQDLEVEEAEVEIHRKTSSQCFKIFLEWVVEEEREVEEEEDMAINKRHKTLLSKWNSILHRPLTEPQKYIFFNIDHRLQT